MPRRKGQIVEPNRRKGFRMKAKTKKKVRERRTERSLKTSGETKHMSEALSKERSYR